MRLSPEERARLAQVLAEVDGRVEDAELGIPVGPDLPLFRPDDPGEVRHTLAGAEGGAS